MVKQWSSTTFQLYYLCLVSWLRTPFLFFWQRFIHSPETCVLTFQSRCLCNMVVKGLIFLCIVNGSQCHRKLWTVVGLVLKDVFVRSKCKMTFKNKFSIVSWILYVLYTDVSLLIKVKTRLILTCSKFDTNGVFRLGYLFKNQPY